MSHPRRFRFGAEMMRPFDGISWAQSALRLQSLGYSTLLVPDHFHEGFGPITASTAAAATTSLKVAPMVLNTDLRHPAPDTTHSTTSARGSQWILAPVVAKLAGE